MRKVLIFTENILKEHAENAMNGICGELFSDCFFQFFLQTFDNPLLQSGNIALGNA